MEIKIKNISYHYLLYASFAITFLMAIIFYNPLILLASSLLLLLSIIYLHSGHIVNTFLLKKLKIIEMSDGYRLEENMKSITKKTGSTYKSLCFAFLNITSPIKEPSEKMEKILQKVSYPFTFIIKNTNLDKNRILEDLETKRSMKEIQLSRIPQSKHNLFNKTKRELSIVEADIRAIAGGNRPIETLFVVGSCAERVIKAEAIGASLSQLEELCSLFSAGFSVNYSVVKGEEIFEVLNW